MRHLKLALLGALAAPMVLVSPAVAQAAIHPSSQTFTGYTYPGTPAGLDACNAEGAWYTEYYGYTDWICKLGQPDAGLYGLYEILKFPVS